VLLTVLVAVVPRTRRSVRARSVDGPGPVDVDIRVLAAGVLAWEIFGIAAGGSYWQHYLLGTVPGLVLAVAAVAGSRPARLRWVSAALAYATVITVAAVIAVLAGARGPGTDVQVEQYLVAHASPGDTAVVAFGDPALLRAAHLSSPYPELWSLPVRVRDPRLTELTQVLTGPHRPTWVVVSGTSLATWGVDATSAEPVLEREYHLVDVAGDWHLYHLDSGGNPS
jgi:hypothetical protein